jgi:L-ascorbate metabolism protein UlaG (beta-lactamase superfamily)
LIKYTHACVRLEDDGRVLVIDPGTFSEPEALDGVSDVLVTHEHFDHIDVDRLRGYPHVRIYTNAQLAAQLEGFHVTSVAVGQTFHAAGFEVKAVGGHHAEIFDGLPGCANIGFIVNGSTGANLYHPGDSMFVPDDDIEHLLVPASGPWMKLGEALGFARAVKPRRAYPIHEFLLSETGIENFGRWMGMKGETDYRRLDTGESAKLA